MIELATNALAAWGSGSTPRLISHRENAVFAVTLGNGQKAALRLHRPGYNSAPEIKSELWWTRALAGAGFPAPAPIATETGAPILHLPDGQIATMIEWVEGAQIGETGTALAGNLPAQTTLYRRLGDLLAELHTTSDAFSLPSDFQRRDWNLEGFLGEAPLWGRFWENPLLDETNRPLILAARQKAFEELTAFAPNADYGLIHADALRENVFRTGDRLTLIDFDDAGFGFRMYDLAVALSQSTMDDNFEALKAALLEGYARHRPLSPHDIEHFTLFITLRAFASFGWIMPRLKPDDPAASRYLLWVTRAAETYLKG
ncbi:MAG: phosphotransferase [Alphaproteobacteria bacterium]|nr:phosphotransferase [Alphaproteobacteria bacterium]